MKKDKIKKDNEIVEVMSPKDCLEAGRSLGFEIYAPHGIPITRKVKEQTDKIMKGIEENQKKLNNREGRKE